MSIELESNNTIATANLLAPNNTPMVGQAYSSSDIDYFKLSNSGAGTANFTLII